MSEIQFTVLLQLEKLLSVILANLRPVALTHFSTIEPATSIVKCFERTVDTEEYAVNAHFRQTEIQRVRLEVAGRGDVDVLVEVLSDCLLAVKTEWLLAILKPMVDAPHVKRNVLAQVAENDLQLGVTVEHSIGHHTEYVKTDTLGKGQWRANEPLQLVSQRIVVCHPALTGRSFQSFSKMIPVGLRGWR